MAEKLSVQVTETRKTKVGVDYPDTLTSNPGIDIPQPRSMGGGGVTTTAKEVGDNPLANRRRGTEFIWGNVEQDSLGENRLYYTKQRRD